MHAATTAARSIIIALMVTAAWIAPARDAQAAPKHPALFTAVDATGPRLRPHDPVHKQSADLVLTTAEWALRIKIPKEPTGTQKFNPDGTYNPAGLRSAKAFLDAGVSLHSVIPVFAVAHQLTGKAVYAERALQWLDEYAGWADFDVSGPDIGGASALVGLVAGYDLFYNEMSVPQRRKLLATIERTGRRFVAKTVRLAKLPLDSNRVVIGNNHNVVPAAAAGVAAVLMKYEGVDRGEALEQVIGTFRRTILPSAFSSDGEYVDGTDNWLVYVMNSMTFFFEALRRTGGPDLWQEGPLRKVPEYYIRADSVMAEETPYNFRWRHTLLALASVYRDGELQGLALKEGLGVSGDAKELGFTQHNAPEDGRTIKRWYSSAWEFLFYDPKVAPKPLRPRPLAVVFPHLGEAILRSSWKADASVLKFRAGPSVGKDEGDNNAFQLRAFGRDILPKLAPSFVRLEDRSQKSYDEQDLILGTEGNNTILVDGARQYSRLDPKFKKVMGPKRQYDDWVRPEKARARVTGFVTTPVADYVAGEAAGAYTDEGGRPLLDTFRRHLVLVKAEYLVIVDELRTAGGVAREVEWRFHGGRVNEIRPTEGGFVFQPTKGAGDPASLRVLRPPLTAKIERMAVQDQAAQTPYVSLRGKRAGGLSVFVVDLRSPERRVTVEADTDALMAFRLGSDLLVWNKTNGPVRHDDVTLAGKAAWIRPDVAAVLIDGTELTWKGTALVRAGSRASGAWSKDGRN